MNKLLDHKRVLILGGTGSLGEMLLRHALSGRVGRPAHVTVMSRDETKQHALWARYHLQTSVANELDSDNVGARLSFRLGDVRDFHAVAPALSEADIVFNAAALKQVPNCEYFPHEAVRTNVGGTENIVTAIRDLKLPVETVIGISTDKAVKPVNVMGMTKALQERILARANLDARQTRFVSVRYGNVLGSRGSLIPSVLEQIRNGAPVCITHLEMTRFLLTLDQAVGVCFSALAHARPGETFVPRVPSARVTDIVAALIGGRRIPTVVTGIRAGEKIHEILVSEDECRRTLWRDGHYVVQSILPELAGENEPPALEKEYSSADHLLTREEVAQLLRASEFAPEKSEMAEQYTQV